MGRNHNTLREISKSDSEKKQLCMGFMQIDTGNENRN